MLDEICGTTCFGILPLVFVFFFSLVKPQDASAASVSNSPPGVTGDFSSVVTSASPCEIFFEKKTYLTTLHILNQPRGALLYFLKSAENPGFFDGMSILGNRGYEDLVLKKDVTLPDGSNVKIYAKGFYGANVLFLEFNLRKFAQGALICEATADFSSFSR